MALTKHQKLAREICRMFNALEDHYQQTAVQLSRIQPNFYTTHLGIHYRHKIFLRGNESFAIFAPKGVF